MTCGDLPPGAASSRARVDRRAALGVWRVAIGLLAGVAVASLLTGCTTTSAAPPPSPSGSSTPYTPTPPRAVDLRTASQALALQISARQVPVDGLDCRSSGTDPTSIRLRCTVTTGGGAGHPDRIAEATWNRTAGSVRLESIEAAPSTPPPPIATVPIAAADGADVATSEVTRAVRRALVTAGALTTTARFTCTDLHAGLAGCEAHLADGSIEYFNVVLEASRLRIYRAAG